MSPDSKPGSRPSVRPGHRLGKDPLNRTGSASLTAPYGQALRHILDLGRSQQPAPCGQELAADAMDLSAGSATPARDTQLAQPGNEVIYREVAGKFSEAMENLCSMAAAAGAWAWSGQSGEGDSFLFMRLMAAYTVTPQVEGVDFRAFLHDVADHWDRFELDVRVDPAVGVIALKQAFTLSRALQAAVEELCWPGRNGVAAMTLAVALDARDRVVMRLYGSRRFFPMQEALAEAKRAVPLLELARCGAIAARLACSDQDAELSMTVLG